MSATDLPISAFLPPIIVIGAIAIGGKLLWDRYAPDWASTIRMDAGCGCADCADCKKEEREAHEESYPDTYDPAHDFLPRYRFPPETTWSKAYNPADSYRGIDYQEVGTVTSDEECTAPEAF